MNTADPRVVLRLGLCALAAWLCAGLAFGPAAPRGARGDEVVAAAEVVVRTEAVAAPAAAQKADKDDEDEEEEEGQDGKAAVPGQDPNMPKPQQGFSLRK